MKIQVKHKKKLFLTFKFSVHIFLLFGILFYAHTTTNYTMMMMMMMGMIKNVFILILKINLKSLLENCL